MISNKYNTRHSVCKSEHERVPSPPVAAAVLVAVDIKKGRRPGCRRRWRCYGTVQCDSDGSRNGYGTGWPRAEVFSHPQVAQAFCTALIDEVQVYCWYCSYSSPRWDRSPRTPAQGAAVILDPIHCFHLLDVGSTGLSAILSALTAAASCTMHGLAAQQLECGWLAPRLATLERSCYNTISFA
jgi:hypothetical protein